MTEINASIIREAGVNLSIARRLIETAHEHIRRAQIELNREARYADNSDPGVKQVMVMAATVGTFNVETLTALNACPDIAPVIHFGLWPLPKQSDPAHEPSLQQAPRAAFAGLAAMLM